MTHIGVSVGIGSVGLEITRRHSNPHENYLYGVRFHEDQNLPGYDAVSIHNLLPTFRRGFVASNLMVHIMFEYLSKRMRG